MKEPKGTGCNKPFIPTKSPVNIPSAVAQTPPNVPGLGSGSNDFFFFGLFFFFFFLRIITNNIYLSAGFTS